MEIFELMLDEVGLGSRPSGLRIGICEVLAKKFCGGAGKCWQVLASAGKCWEGRRNGASLCDFVRSLQISSLRFSTPCSPFGGGGFKRLPPIPPTPLTNEAGIDHMYVCMYVCTSSVVAVVVAAAVVAEVAAAVVEAGWQGFP